MKRVLCLLTVIALLLCGCGDPPANTETTITSETTTATTTVAETTESIETEENSTVTDIKETFTNDTTPVESTTTTTANNATASSVTTTTATNSIKTTHPSQTTATTQSVQTNTTTVTKTIAEITTTTPIITTTAAMTMTTTTTTQSAAATKPTKTKKPSRTTVTTGTTTTTVSTTAADPNGITILEPQDNLVVEAQASVVDQYLSITNEKKAAEFWTGLYTHTAHGARFFIRWQSKGNLWKVYFSEDPQFTDVKPAFTTDMWMQFSGLMPGCTYYWKVVNTFGVESETRRVTVKDTTVRWIDADGGDNIRDLGGWKTESGKTVKYGLLYRGGCIDGYNGGPALTQSGCDTFRWLGIKSELDLRGGDARSDSSPFGGKYYKTTMTQYDYIFDNKETKASLKTIFNILSFKGAYPVYFHCNAGADRTGTLSFIINGLLGVSYEDLTRDFELTGFSGRGKRLRSKLDEATATFDPSGVMQKGDGNYIAWGPLHDTMLEKYGTASGKLSDAIANFLITECGVTQQEIDAVRSIMLD